MQLRPYQAEAIDAVFDYWHQGGGNPLVDLATGTGKSMVIATLIRRLIEQYPEMNVLMLVHVRELVQQNAQALLRAWPQAPLGIFSAGLGRRDTHRKIIFGSIQSLFRQDGYSLGHRDLILIDEAHLVPAKGEGMYRKLIDKLRQTRPDLRVAGFTATPYRLDSGRLDRGEDRLFDEVVYTYGVAQGISDGFLSPLISRAGISEIDVSGVQRRGGEFIAEQMEIAADKITDKAVKEIVGFGENRKSWLIFCSGVKHAETVRNLIRSYGISCETVTGETPKGERDSILRRYKDGQIRCLTNAQVLTTGFDAPQVDMVVFLRSTLSTSLYVQIVGRGTRLASDKENCLILDFGGNIRRHGPVDAIVVGEKRGGSGKDDGEKVSPDSVRAKECPDCLTYVGLATRTCPSCGHEWPAPVERPKHEDKADDSAGILSTEKVAPQMAPVVAWRFDLHEKAGSPDSVRVTYTAGIADYREWLAFGHGGYARQKACQWWTMHGGATPFPVDACDALARQRELTMPATVSIRRNGKFDEIVGRTFPRRDAAE